MIVRKKEETSSRARADGVVMTDFFGDICRTDGKVSMGHAAMDTD